VLDQQIRPNILAAAAMPTAVFIADGTMAAVEDPTPSNAFNTASPRSRSFSVEATFSKQEMVRQRLASRE
jgi:hypothetical protein